MNKNNPANSNNPNPWQTQSSEVKYDNPWIKVVENKVINPAGNNGIYGVVHFKNLAIGIIPMDSQQNIWLVGQYRYPLNQYSWEIPEGGGNLAISPLKSAKRELLEETGLTAQKWTKIQKMHLSNSVSNELAIIYLAQNLTLGKASPEETEKLEIQKIPLQKAYQMVSSGKITDSLSVAAILKLKLMLLENKL